MDKKIQRVGVVCTSNYEIKGGWDLVKVTKLISDKQKTKLRLNTNVGFKF